MIHQNKIEGFNIEITKQFFMEQLIAIIKEYESTMFDNIYNLFYIIDNDDAEYSDENEYRLSVLRNRLIFVAAGLVDADADCLDAYTLICDGKVMKLCEGRSDEFITYLNHLLLEMVKDGMIKTLFIGNKKYFFSSQEFIDSIKDKLKNEASDKLDNLLNVLSKIKRRIDLTYESIIDLSDELAVKN